MLTTVARKGPLTGTFLRLRQLREEHHLTQRELAAMTGISQPTIAAWESGRVQDLSLDAIRRLAPAYGMTPETLTRYLNGQPSDSAPAKQPELYDAAPQTVPVTMVRVAEVTIAAGLERWRTLMQYPVSSEIVGGRRDVLMVRVTGDCLEPEIQAGDMALIDRENLSPRTGALVAVLLEDGQLVMKRFGISPADRRPVLTDNTGAAIRPNGARIIGTIIHVSRTVY